MNPPQENYNLPSDMGMPKLKPGPSIDEAMGDIEPGMPKISERESLESETNRLAIEGYKMLIAQGYSHNQAIQRLFGDQQNRPATQHEKAYNELIKKGISPQEANRIIKTAIDAGMEWRGSR